MTHALFKFLPALLLALLMPLLVAGCNTIEGLGEDTEAAGDAVEDEAEEEEED
jgi:entericidin B